MMKALLAPREAIVTVTARPRPWRAAALLGALLVLLGALTLPRQLPALAALLLGPGGPPHGAALLAGLRRLAVFDRVIPPFTPVLAAFGVFLLAGAWLPESPAARRRLAAVLVTGLAPLAVQRLGELATVWLVPFDGFRPGDVLTAPRLFATGPLLLAVRDGSSTVLDLLDARLNLITLWVAGIWALGLQRLEGERWAAWHVGVPLLALVGAGALTWWLGGPTLMLVLGRP